MMRLLFLWTVMVGAATCSAAANADTNCRSSAAQAVFDSLATADRLPQIQSDQSTKEKLADAGNRMRRSGCDPLSLFYAEITVANVYSNMAKLDEAARHLAGACEYAAAIEDSEQRVSSLSGCLPNQLSLLIETGQFDRANRVAIDLGRLLSKYGIDSGPVGSLLKQNFIAALMQDDAPKRHAYERALDAVLTGEPLMAWTMLKETFASSVRLQVGEYQAALSLAEDAHRLMSRVPGVQTSSLSLQTLSTLAAVHLELGDPDQAMRVLAEGDALTPTILSAAAGDSGSLLAAHHDLVKFLVQEARAQLLLNRTADSSRTIAKAAQYMTADGFEILDVQVFGVERMRNLIQVQLRGGTPEARRLAQADLKQAGDLVGGWMMRTGRDLNTGELAELRLELPHLLPTATPAEQIHLHAILASALGAAGSGAGRIEHDLAAIDLIEQSRLQAKGTDALALFFAPHVRIYEDLVSALYTQRASNIPFDSATLGKFGHSYAEAALYFAEAAHARRFDEQYGPALRSAFLTRAQLSTADHDRELQLRESMASASSALDLFATHDLVGARRRSQATSREYDDFIQELASRYTDAAALIFPRPITPPRLPRALDDRYLLVYEVTDVATYWWIIFNNEILAFERTAIDRSALVVQVTQFTQWVDDDKKTAPLAGSIVRDQFERIEELASSRTSGVPRVVIVPDDVLHRVAWEPLRTARGVYVGDVFITSYAPSLTALVQSTWVDRTAAKTALVITHVQEQETRIPMAGGTATYEPLPPDEGRRIVAVLTREHYRTDTLEGADATVARLLANDVTPYTVVHFDTHAFAQSIEPPPSLLLHPTFDSPYGLLRFEDIPRLKFRATLVTLSACQSALGKKVDPLAGEGIESLAKMFMIAGSKSVLASLWLANQATPALMEKFYEEYTVSGDSAMALFRAKSAIRRLGWPNPDSWAPFILFGDPH